MPVAAKASQVGRRKARAPVILQVDASRAHASGIVFYRGNDLAWLANGLRAGFIK